MVQINNENLKNEVKNAERREEIIKQVQQENQSKFIEGIVILLLYNIQL